MADRIPVIFDTDIGSDIDDAVALAYLLRQPHCELLGITTVSGEAAKRASIADAVVKASDGPKISIHTGVSSPLIVPQNQSEAPQHTALTTEWPHAEYVGHNTALGFLAQTIRARPHEISLLAVGPLTNIALLFSAYPETASMLGELMLMGGRYLDSPAVSRIEWNIRCDPHAAAIVFGAPVPKLTAVGLDVTTRCTLPRNECKARFAEAGGTLDLVSAMADVWFEHTETVTFHDPLAAALLFEPNLCGIVGGKVSIDLSDSELLGVSRFNKGVGPHRVAESVQRDLFFEHYFEIISA